MILLAPLADSLIKKLVAESPDKYSTGQPSKYIQIKVKAVIILYANKSVIKKWLYSGFI